MKNLPAILLSALLLTACHHGPKKHLHGAYTDFPFQKDSTYDWEINADPKNEMLVLNALKAQENGDTASLSRYFAETVNVQADSIKTAVPLTQLQKALASQTAAGKTIKVKVEDWHSVTNSDHSQEWVTVRYTQYITNKASHTDSLQCTDDSKVETGRIVQVRGFVRHFPVLGVKRGR